MTHVSDLPGDLQATLAGRDLILFDGECVLCSGFFRTIVRLDRAERFFFATAQSPLGAALYDALDLPATEFETNLVIVDGAIHQRLDAFAAAMSAVGWPWRALAVLRFIPEPLRSFLYHRLARNRYAIFGRYDTCMMPDPHLRARFLDRMQPAA
jgi:predicted DCC family thiol-disulfide oxidoreductase YuxK